MFHPYEKEVMMGLDKDNNLLHSEDGGKKWIKKKENIIEFTFAKYSDKSYFASKDRIFAIVEDRNSKN